MTIDGEALIRQQLGLTQTTEVSFPDGRKTTLTPARWVAMRADASCRVSLNGTWRVARWPFATDEDRLVAPGVDDRRWEAIDQPGKVFYADPEQKPGTVPNWNRVTLAHIAPDDGAVMRRTVTIPRAWAGRHIWLRFNGIYPAGRVYVNGVRLGEHLSGLTPVEWDVTPRVKPGRPATVAVRLLRRHKHVQLDMPRHAIEFAGLAQDAFFHATEPCGIRDYHLVTGLDAACRKGTVSGTLDVENRTSKAHVAALTVSLVPAAGGKAMSVRRQVTLAAGQSKAVAVRLNVARPQLWNDESPFLYELAMTSDVRGQPRQRVAFRTGFRRLDLAGGRPRLNGNPVKFRGVNHLTFHPEHGMYTPEPWLRQCLTLMKKANVNAIRTHFLGPAVLADLCDELGIYLLQELPIDWGTHFIHDPEWVGPALMRIEGGIRRDRHHPSVMVWSVGNENMPESAAVAEDGWNHLRIFHRFCKVLDPSRPTMFPPPGPANKITGIFEVRVGDIADTHYSFELQREFRHTGRVKNPRSWEADMEETTREEAMARGWSGVWFSSEYGIINLMPDLLNAPYLSIISDTQEDPLSGKNTQQVFIDRLRREWGNMRDDPSCLGGAYFPWLCSGAGNNPWGWVRWGEDADWGVVTADLLPKPAFWALRVLFSPVQFSQRVVWEKGQQEITIEVTNGYNSRDLGQCTLRTLMAGGMPWAGMMREWRDIPVACPPGGRTPVRVPLWNPGSVAALEKGAVIVCRCILLDPQGYRPITADVLVVPREIAETRALMPIGPDAVSE